MESRFKNLKLKELLVILSMVFFYNTVFCQNLDIDLLREINLKRNTNLDRTFRFISNTATPIAIASPLSIIAAGLVQHDQELTNKGLVSATSILAAVAISTAIKYAVARERPFKKYPDIQKEAAGGSFSFPSGHTNAAFCTATSLSLTFPKWYVIVPSYAWACAVGYSRMHLGVHYPTDVLGGIIVGTGCSFITYKVQQWMKKSHQPTKPNSQ